MTLNEKKAHGRKDETVIDRLSEVWPEPREQLHFGGWKATYELVEKLELDHAEKILDICCGEGYTANWLAKKYERSVVGIDILDKAIAVAQETAKKMEVSNLVEFKTADVFKIPYPDSTFNVIFGQDPDGLAHKDRIEIFRELKRLLQPQGRLGFQLWLPGLTVPEEKIKFFESVTVESGWPEMVRLSVKEFIQDLSKAGFTNIIIEDVSEIYYKHMSRMKKIFRKKGKTIDKWHKVLLKLMKDGYKIGVRIYAKVKKNETSFNFSQELPKADNLYYYGTGVFSPDVIFDFDTIAEEKRFRKWMFAYLKKNYSMFDWHMEGEGVLASGAVDNYSPPKVGSFLSVNLNDIMPTRKYNLRIRDGVFIDCEIENIYIDFYHFNCAILHFIVNIPENSWQDKEVLERVRFFVQKHTHPYEEFGIDLESIFSPLISELNQIFKKMIAEIKPPILKTPFLDFTQLSEEITTQLFWTHSTLVTIMPNVEDLDNNPFICTLLNLNPHGIYNYSVKPDVFTFVESGDSLIYLLNKPDIRNRSPETIANEDWIQWIAIHHYTWKTAWELDRGFYILLNLVTSHLKHKRTEKYRDVYAVNALINHIMLVLDTHKSRNVTSTYYSIYFLEQISKAWRTSEILDAAEVKMSMLRDLISQLDEIEEARRSKRVELFLSLLGVFTLGSLVLDFIGALSFGGLVPDIFKLLLAMGIPIIFSIVAYRLLKD